tara:strand:+ start:704 stop:1318 length:615 start_codon:yes stop_codon:yes gene_type:complete
VAAGDTAVTICSDALILLGAKSISSFNDGTDEANAADRLYPDVRDSTLTVFPWSFAFKKAQLARLLTTPTSEWRYQFQMPGDRLGNPRQVFLNNNINPTSFKDFEIQGDLLLTNEETIFIDYPFQTEEFAMPKYFVQLMKYMMAWHLAYPITEQETKTVYWQTVAIGTPSENGRGGYMRTAMQNDAAGNPSKTIEEFALVDTRF